MKWRRFFESRDHFKFNWVNLILGEDVASRLFRLSSWKILCVRVCMCVFFFNFLIVSYDMVVVWNRWEYIDLVSHWRSRGIVLEVYLRIPVIYVYDSLYCIFN